MAYPYDRDFFDYQPQQLAAPIGYDFYNLPQPTEHLAQEALAYNGWRTTATAGAPSAEWRPAAPTWAPQVEHVPYVDISSKPPRLIPPPIDPVVSKPFRCQICGKAFSQAANLTAHNRVHTGEKPFECPVCNRPFSQSSSLVTHRRTHTGERPYPCKHCDKAFTDSSTLTKHLRTHTGQKPYGCPLCSMRFTQSGNLHRHMKTHKH